MRFEETWDWLRSSPLLWLTLTVGAYELGRRLRARTGHPLAQPVLVTVVVVAVALTAGGIDYDDYADAVRILTFLLGPATVALAIPLYHQRHRVRGYVLPLLVAMVVGAAVSIGTAVGLLELLGGSDELAETMAPKASTAPVAIALTERLGGIPELTAVFTTIAGTLGAVLGPSVLNLLRVRDPRARGLAVGAVAHGIGTSRMLHEDPLEGAFSGLAMGLTALATCLLAGPMVALLL